MSKEELQQLRPALDGAFDDAALSPLLRSVRLDVDWLRLGALVGRGSFGAVYATSWIAGDGAAGSRLLADAGAPQALAVKSIYSQQLQNDMQLSRVKRALETELQLQPHAHICRCFAWACSVQSGQLLLVYEYCEGGTLKAALDTGRTAAWPMSRKLLVASQLAEGLASLHGHEPPVVHRDLKPDNVLFDARGAVKICDLGLSRPVDTQSTMTGAVGTPVFLAPEQLTYQRYDQASDVWSAGCVLACLSSGSVLPYPDSAEEGLLARIARGEIRPSVPEACPLHAAVRGCCHAESTERLTAAELAEAVVGLLVQAAK